jgi:hypothetical protein
MTLFKRIADGFAGIIVGLGLAAVLMGPAAMALVFPGQYAPRYFPTQQTHYERHVVNITATSFQADTAQNVCLFTAGTCSVRIGAVPYNAFILRSYTNPVVVCNAVTTCTLSLGTTSGGTQLVNAQDIKGSANGVANTIVAANLGIAATGNNIASTGADGGFDLYVTITFTGAAPSAGTVAFVLEYAGANDGGCPTNVPLASTAGPC